jgi:hypothetical protein
VKRRAPTFWIALLSGATVVLCALVDIRRTSPGPLSTPHAREVALAAEDGCSECHGGWFESMTDACLECHAGIDADLQAGAGLHGLLGAERARHCARCHGEHNGASFALVNRRSFAAAGVAHPEAFEHRQLGFAMSGKHLALDCAECHANARTVVLPAGGQRYRGLDQACETCHTDPHAERYVVACSACHGQEDWKELAATGHERVLPLVGGHGGLACSACHPPAGPHATDLLGQRLGPAPRRCIDCHESPHAEAFVARSAAAEHKNAGAVCVTCHAPEHETFRDERLVLAPEAHARSGFRLDAPHAEVACADCHGPPEATFTARYPGRGPDQCSACHEDPHAGQFARGPFSGGDCSACHAREHFDPVPFTRVEHARTALALEGAHAELDCHACHVDPPPGVARVFRGTPSDCASCHHDAHDGFFGPFTRDLPPVANGDCARCHLTTTFAELAATFEHARWTGFAVGGAHLEAGCEACHLPAEAPDQHGRRFGRVADRHGPHPGCVACHADVHGGTFERADLPARVDGRAGCGRCHGDVSFRDVSSDFEHGRWTGFVLDGAHAEARCADCHAPLAEPGEDGRSFARAAGSACSDCHADPHAGQFSVAGRTTCARCHTDELASFLAFDHERDARFRLGEAHRDLACSACHQREAEGPSVVRYRPLGTACSDCHEAREEVLLRRRSKRE